MSKDRWNVINVVFTGMLMCDTNGSATMRGLFNSLKPNDDGILSRNNGMQD